MRLRVLSLGVLAFLGAACSDKAPPILSIEGDWFLCTTPNCLYLSWDGTRYAADGTYNDLMATGGALEETELYCEDPRDTMRGQYAYDGQFVTKTTISGETSSFPLEITDEEKGIACSRLAAGDFLAKDTIYYYLRITPTRSYGVCPDIRKPCSPTTCPTGCCANDVCKVGNTLDGCGSGGVDCVFCPGTCVDHRCQ